MIGQAITEESLANLIASHAVREVLVGRFEGRDDKWMLSVRIGGPGARLIPLRSKREAVRTWASLTAVGRFADRAGLRGFVVEL